MITTKEARCLLCGGADLSPTEGLSGEELRRLWKALGKAFSEAAWGKIGPNTQVQRQRCAQCGFEFAEPSLAGNEQFYRELDSVGYYCPHRPEFERTKQFAQRARLRRVLDVGCGSGFFLDSLKAAGLETCGLELNQEAADQAAVKGHRIFRSLLHELQPAQTGGGFDLITLFQVLEHVSEPVKLLREAAALLNPGGVIGVAVPSAAGVYRLAPLDPHQWPPHHISLWREADLAQAARAAGLRVVESGADRLVGADLAHFWRLHNQLAPALGRARHPGGDWLPGLVSWCYRKSGAKLMFSRHGLSLYAVMTV